MNDKQNKSRPKANRLWSSEEEKSRRSRQAATQQFELLQKKYRTETHFLRDVIASDSDFLGKYIKDKSIFIKSYHRLLDQLKVDCHQLKIIELGPAHGFFLDVAKERGALSTTCVDYNPNSVIYNKLKGHQSFLVDYINTPLNPLLNERYDFILSKGSIQACAFELNGELFFKTWLDDLESLLSDTGQILITPTFRKQKTAIGNMAHYCSNLKTFQQSFMVQNFVSRGYHLIYIEKTGYNQPDIYPVSFYKNKVKQNLHHSDLIDVNFLEWKKDSSFSETCIKCMQDDGYCNFL